ncbi:MAG: transcription antitermination factor NusB [Bacteroidales bacterium]|nr:transcription antitermination factor NusB [Bacteroidales bacterium]
MLNRHFLRAKVLQSLYAYHTSGQKDINFQEKWMFNNIDEMYDLEVYLLSIIFEIKDIASELIEEGKNKFYPTEEERNPSYRFVNNPMFDRMAECEELMKNIKRLHISWHEQKEILRQIFIKFKGSDSYKDYMNKEEVTFEEHRRVIVQLFKNYIIRNASFYELLIERHFSWEDDYEYLCQVVIVLLRNWEDGDCRAKQLSTPFDNKAEDTLESDQDFMKNLFRNTAIHWDEYDSLIEKRIMNWDMDRIAFIDMIIIKMAISEFLYSPIIPLRVSLNEYIELSKEFSTEKSRLFVNGILDRIIIDLRQENRIHKYNDDEYLLENSDKEQTI